MDDLLRHLDVQGVEVAYHEGSLQLNVSIKIAAAIGYANAKGAQKLAPARLSKESTERDAQLTDGNRRLHLTKAVQIFR